MPIVLEHVFKEKSTELFILLPLRTIYNRTFQCETPCNTRQKLLNLVIFQESIKTKHSTGKVT